MTLPSSSSINKFALLALIGANEVYAQRRTRRGSRIARGAIAGIVVAIVVAFIVLALLLWCCCFRRRRRTDQSGVAGVSPSGRLGLPFFGSKPFRPPQGAPPPPVDPLYDQGYAPGFQQQGMGTGAAAAAGVGEGDGQYYSPPAAPPPTYVQNRPQKQTGRPFVGGFKPEV